MFGPGKRGQIFVSESGAYISETPFRCSTLGQAPCLAPKHWTKLERLARDKHTSLLRTLIRYVLEHWHLVQCSHNFLQKSYENS
jgi:hypothetical protein